MATEWSPGSLRNAALNYLARREHSRQELRDKLLRKGADKDQVDTLLDQLIEQNLLSDHRFAESFVRSRTSQGKGPYLIRQELRLKGVSGEVIDGLLDSDDQSWREAALQLVQRRFPTLLERGDEARDGVPERMREKARCLRFLRARGYSVSLVSDILGSRSL